MATLAKRGIGIDLPHVDAVTPPCEEVDEDDDGMPDMAWVPTENAAVRYSHLALRFAAIHLLGQLTAAIELDRNGHCDPAFDGLMGYVTQAHAEVLDLVEATAPAMRNK